MSNDGWVTVTAGRTSAYWGVDSVTFYTNSTLARVPYVEGAPDRGSWQVSASQPHLLRFVFDAQGVLKTTRYGNGTGKRSKQVSKAALQTSLGRVIEGRYPCTIDGFTITIDLSEPLS